MSAPVRRFALATHLLCSIGWIGAVAAYLTLGLVAVTSTESEQVRGAYLLMEPLGWFVIVPLAVASLLTGLVMSLGTRWGLFRHYWVVFSLALTVLANVVLLLHMPTVSDLADRARGADVATLDGLGGDLAHPAIGLVVLVVILFLNVYKPRGVIRARGYD